MRQRAVWLGGLLAALMAFGAPARAQETPTRAARSFFDALAEHRWRDAAMLVHPLRRASFQEEELAVLVAWAESEQARRLDAQSGSGGIVGFSSDGVLRPEQLAKHGHRRVPGFGGLTLAGAAALPSEEFMARFLEASALDADSTFLPSGERFARRILGEVIESDTVAHVLYRIEGSVVEYTDDFHVEIAQLRRRGGRWLVWPQRMNLDFASSSRLHVMDMVEQDSQPDPWTAGVTLRMPIAADSSVLRLWEVLSRDSMVTLQVGKDAPPTLVIGYRTSHVASDSAQYRRELERRMAGVGFTRRDTLGLGTTVGFSVEIVPCYRDRCDEDLAAGRLASRPGWFFEAPRPGERR